MYAVTISMKTLSSEGFKIVKKASQEVVGSSLAEPGCIHFDVLFDQDSLSLTFYEAYKTRNAFELHLQAAHTKLWADKCLPYIERETIKMPETISEWSTSTEHRVVVFGATGKIGSELVKLLVQDPGCDEVIVLSRNIQSASSRRLALLDPKVSLRSSAMDDLETSCLGATEAFVIAPVVDDMADWHASVASALKKVGVDHIVKVSVTGARSPESDPPPGRFPSLHWAGEEAFRHSGIKTTVIRPTIFMQHFEMGTGIYTRGDHRVFLPVGDANVAFLDCRDIAKMGYALLMSSRAIPFHGGAYELTGPEAITGHKIVEVISAVRGDTVVYHDTMEEFTARCEELGQSDWPKAVYQEAREGWFAELATDEFEAIVGHKPRSFCHYVDDRVYWFKE